MTRSIARPLCDSWASCWNIFVRYTIHNVRVPGCHPGRLRPSPTPAAVPSTAMGLFRYLDDKFGPVLKGRRRRPVGSTDILVWTNVPYISIAAVTRVFHDVVVTLAVGSIFQLYFTATVDLWPHLHNIICPVTRFWPIAFTHLNISIITPQTTHPVGTGRGWGSSPGRHFTRAAFEGRRY